MTDARRWAPAILFVAVLAVYAPALDNGFIYDDHDIIEMQPRPSRPGDLTRVFAEPQFRGLPYYRPVTRFTLLGQKALHGDRPALFRAANAALMGAAALLVVALLRTPSFGVARAPAFGAAALFALHPIASGCVVPISSGRETLLPTVLMLVAVLAWLRGRRAGAWAGFALALFAKEQAVVVPVLFALADLCGLPPDPRPRSAPGWLRRYAPAAAIALVYAAARVAVLGPGQIEIALLDQPFAPLLSYAFALQVGVAPFVELAYEPELAIWLSPVRLGVAFAALVALGIAAHRVGAPPAPVLAFWTGWFLIVQLPTAGVVRQEAPFAERYAYLALLALPAVAAAVASARWDDPRFRRRAGAAWGVVLAIATALNVGRADVFRDDATFATQWLRTNPASPDAHHTLGIVRLQEGRTGEAIEHLRRALAGSGTPAEIQVNLGIALAVQRRDAEAEAAFRAALEAAPEHPEAHLNLGMLHARHGRLDEAIAHYRAALDTNPRTPGARNALAGALEALGRPDEALAEYSEALRLDPEDAEARRNRERLRAGGRPPAPPTVR
jgi:tetratricopeptide (TPR) repeat protein